MQGTGSYRAEDVDDLLWRYVRVVISDPDILADAFKKYGERLKSSNSPTRTKLKTAKKWITNTERKLSRLLDLYLDEAIDKKQYTARRKPLDIQLEQQSEDVDTLSQELEQSIKVEGQMQSITKFTEVTAAELEGNTEIGHRREVINGLGLRFALGKNGRSRYLNAVFCFADDFNPNQHATYSVRFNCNNKVIRIPFVLPLALKEFYEQT